MTETFISFGTDAAAVAAALADRLMSAGVAVALDGGRDEGIAEGQLRASLERADKIVLLVSPDWSAERWPTLERHLARTSDSAAAFLAKLVTIDLSDGAAVPAVLRPLLKSGMGLTSSHVPTATSIEAIAAVVGRGRRDTVVTVDPFASEDGCRPVFVVGHPGSGKSTFCRLLAACLATRGLSVLRIDPYPFLQTLFRVDELRGDTTRFEADALSEFVIKDASVLDESIVLMKDRLLKARGVAGEVAVVELAFSDGSAMADIMSVCPGSFVVHIDAPLESCRRNNAARGDTLRKALCGASSPSLVFDRLSDVHYVPPAFYQRYERDPGSWHDGAARLSARLSGHYHRLENLGGDLSAYLEACRAFMDAIVLPGLGPAIDARPPTCGDRKR